MSVGILLKNFRRKLLIFEWSKTVWNLGISQVVFRWFFNKNSTLLHSEFQSKSNSIELNPWIEFDWVRQSNEIEHHTFSEFDFRTNRIQSNKSNSIELNPSRSDYVRLSQSNTIKWISFDWLWWTYTKQAQSKPVKASFSCAFFLLFIQ